MGMGKRHTLKLASLAGHCGKRWMHATYYSTHYTHPMTFQKGRMLWWIVEQMYYIPPTHNLGSMNRKRSPEFGLFHSANIAFREGRVSTNKTTSMADGR